VPSASAVKPTTAKGFSGFTTSKNGQALTNQEMTDFVAGLEKKITVLSNFKIGKKAFIDVGESWKRIRMGLSSQHCGGGSNPGRYT
jgi:hypothetical protein